MPAKRKTKSKRTINLRRFIKTPWLFVLVFVVLGGLYILRSDASSLSASLYKCASRDMHASSAPSVTPADPAGNSVATASQNTLPTVCPSGMVPMPKALKGPKDDPKSFSVSDRVNGAIPPSTSLGGYWYSWSQGQQSVVNGGGTALYEVQQNQQPWVNYAYSSENHSLGQIWALDDSDPYGYSDIETGWSESLGQFGDYSPHLFIYHFDQGVGMGYAPLGGWVQVSSTVYPNMPLPHGSAFHTYGVQRFGTNWWVYYDGTWVGYYPASAYPRHFPYYLTEIEAGGEVAAVEKNTCSDMGDAYRGTSNVASEVAAVYWTNGAGNHWADLSPYNSDPSVYTTGNWSGNLGFHFGGPGWC